MKAFDIVFNLVVQGQFVLVEIQFVEGCHYDDLVVIIELGTSNLLWELWIILLARRS